MIKFCNEKSEVLYNKLLDKYGESIIISGRGNSSRKRFPIDEKLGVNKTLFALAEYTECNEFRKIRPTRAEKTINKIRSLDFDESNIRKFMGSNILSKLIKLAIKRSQEKTEQTEVIITDAINSIINEKGYLFVRNLLKEELDKLNKEIEEQQNDLREAETKKEQCLILLYGTTEKEG